MVDGSSLRVRGRPFDNVFWRSLDVNQMLWVSCDHLLFHMFIINSLLLVLLVERTLHIYACL